MKYNLFDVEKNLIKIHESLYDLTEATEKTMVEVYGHIAIIRNIVKKVDDVNLERAARLAKLENQLDNLQEKLVGIKGEII